MRILLLAHNLRVAGGLSVGKNIVSTLPVVAPNHTYLVTAPADMGYGDTTEDENVRTVEVRASTPVARARFELTVMPRLVDEFMPDWIWALGNIPYPRPPCRQSLLMHNPHRLYRCRGAITPPVKRLREWLLDIALRTRLKYVNRVYCQTETMRRRFVEKLGFDPNRIGLCPNAVSTAVKKGTGWPVELKGYENKFVLFTLTKYYPHKNLERIVECFHMHRNELRDVICVMSIAPDQGAGAKRLIERIHQANLEDAVLTIGSISQDRLGEFYHAAGALFLPTMLESFTSTYLEAMYCDTPIITSDLDFAREICAEAAYYVNPLSLQSMCHGILRVQCDSALQKRLVAYGRRRHSSYVRTWSDILKHVLEQEGIEHDGPPASGMH